MEKYIFKTGVFLFLIMIAPLSLIGQTRYSALIPDKEMSIQKTDQYLRVAADAQGTETAKSFFQFNFNHLPQNATFSGANLNLYKVEDSGISDFSTQNITILKGTNSWTGTETSLNDSRLAWAKLDNNRPIGRITVKKSTKETYIKLNPRSLSGLTDGLLSLAARAPDKEQYNRFYSTNQAQTKGNYFKKSKLVVQYTITAPPFRSDWAQASGAAQHQSFLNWEINASTTSAKVTQLPIPNNDYIVGADPTGAVLLYKNKPLVFTQSTRGTGSVYSVKYLEANGKEIWSKPVDAMAKSWPMIDELGRLYYISTGGNLTILDLTKEGEQLYFKSLASITNNQISRLNNNATLGYDGTLYLVDDRSIIALSAYPQLKIRWKYEFETNERCGPIALSPDEQYAFFISINTQQKNARLVQLNNMNGVTINASDSKLGAYSDGSNYYIPAPVVASPSRVFVLNGFDSGDKLMTYKYGAEGLSDESMIKSPSGKVSQPVVDKQGNVFLVYNKKMARYDAAKTAKVEVYNVSANLNAGTILIADASGNIYASDPYSSIKKFYGFNFDTSLKQSFEVNAGTNTMKNLILAADGTLYSSTKTALLKISPQRVSEENYTVNATELRAHETYRATSTLTINPMTINPGVNTIFYGGKKIVFKNGFRVKNGARLVCKNGF